MCFFSCIFNTIIPCVVKEENFFQDNFLVQCIFVFRYGRPRAVKVLLELGANTESKSAYDTTPLESAMSQENDEIINILASHTPEPPSKKIRLIV